MRQKACLFGKNSKQYDVNKSLLHYKIGDILENWCRSWTETVMKIMIGDVLG